MVEKFTVAAHLITQSCDHYTLLLSVVDADDFVRQLEEDFSDEFAYIDRHYITTNIDEFDKKLSDALNNRLEELWDSE